MADKARDAFRTISEVANWLDIPAHVLRFWESKFPQIKPVKRAGGRRYYRPADMRLIGGIKKLLHDDGLTIRGVQKMLKEDGVKSVSDLAPALDMPTEEEGAARRLARRARRQERQAAKASSGAAPQSPDPEDTQDSQDDTEAPFTHVEDEPTGGDNVVSINGERATEADDIPTDDETDEVIVDAAPDETAETQEPELADIEDALDPAAEEAISSPVEPVSTSPAPEPEPEPVVDEPEAEEAIPEAPVEQPVSTIPVPAFEEPETTAEEPVSAPEPEPVLDEPTPTPQPDVPADPDPADVTLTEAQNATAATLKLLRRQTTDTSKNPDSEALRRAALDQLAELRARMASNLG